MSSHRNHRVGALLRASLGLGQDFSGPFAKPQRMFTATLAGLFGALTPLSWQHFTICSACNLEAGFAAIFLFIIFVGTFVTSLRRLRTIARRLRTEEGDPS